MELYFIRHGIAVERDGALPDPERPLTEKGRQKTTKVAQRFSEIGVRFDLILSSPLLRAKQTAEILLEANLSSQVQEFSALAPGGDMQQWLKWWEKSDYHQDKSCLALVGHEPDLGNWAQMLLWDKIEDKLVLKKGGVLALELPVQGNPLGQSLLFLLTSPKWL